MFAAARSLCALFLAGLLTACATSPPAEPVFTYNEVVIINRLRVPVQDVNIEAIESGRVFSCGNIAPRGICSNKFPARPYYGDPVQVTWRVAGGGYLGRQLKLQLPQDYKPELPLRGVLVIGAGGALSSYLEQEAPGPHF